MKINQTDVIVRTSALLFIAVFAGIVLLTDDLSATVSWLLLFGALLMVHRNNSRAMKMAVLGYLMVSIFGVIMMTDNFTNFGTYFGGGHDDSDFFYTVLNNLEGRDYRYETALFERINIVYAKVLSLLKLNGSFTTSIFDVVPLNWFVMANTLVVVDQIVKRLINKYAPMWVILIPLLFSYNVIFNAVLFYRDVYVILFISLAIRSVVDSKYGMAFLFAVATGMFRGGNGFIIMLFVCVSYLSILLGKINLHKFYLGGAGLLIVLFLFTGLAAQGGLIFALGSKATQFNKYSGAFGDLSYTEVITKRTADKALRGDNLDKIEALGSGGVKSFAYKAAYSFLFPITFYAPNRESNVHKFKVAYNQEKYEQTDDGYFYFTFVQWMVVLGWLVVLPLLVVGFYYGLKSKNIQFNNISYLYLITFIMISQISFSARHTMAFIILHPIIMAWGYDNYKKHKTALLLLGAVTALGIFAYNYMKFA